MSDDLLFEQELLEGDLRREALVWWERGHHAQMRGELDEAIELYSRSIYPYFNLGRIYEQQGNLIRAMNCYKAAYNENNQYIQALKAHRRLQSKLN